MSTASARLVAAVDTDDDSSTTISLSLADSVHDKGFNNSINTVPTTNAKKKSLSVHVHDKESTNADAITYRNSKVDGVGKDSKQDLKHESDDTDTQGKKSVVFQPVDLYVKGV